MFILNHKFVNFVGNILWGIFSENSRKIVGGIAEENKTKVFSVKLHLDLKFWSNQNKVKFIFISHLDKCCMDKCHSETYPLILILLVRSMHQIYIWSKQCWSNNIEAKKFQQTNIFVFKKNVGSKSLNFFFYFTQYYWTSIVLTKCIFGA